MHRIIRVLFAFAILVLPNCGGMLGERGNGVIVTENFSVSDFNRIEVEGNFEIRLEKSGNPGVSVTTDENLLDFISVESRGDRLVLISEKNLISEEGVQVVISYSELRGISVGGAAILTSDQTIAEDYLDLEMSGA